MLRIVLLLCLCAQLASAMTHAHVPWSFWAMDSALQSAPKWDAKWREAPSRLQGGPYWVADTFTWHAASDTYALDVCSECALRHIELYRDGVLVGTWDRHLGSPQALSTGTTFDALGLQAIPLDSGHHYLLQVRMDPVLGLLPFYNLFNGQHAFTVKGLFFFHSMLYFGFGLAMLALNLVLVWAARFATAQYYFGFLSTYLGLAFLYTPLPVFFWGELGVAMTKQVFVLICLSCFFSTRFVLQYLELHSDYPRLHRVLWHSGWVFVVWGLAHALHIVPEWLNFDFEMMVLVVFSLFLLSCWRALNKGWKASRLLILAFGAYLMGLVLFLIHQWYWEIPWLVGQDHIAPYLGHSLEVGVFTSYIAYRVILSYRESDRLQAEALFERKRLLQDVAHEVRTPLVVLYDLAERKRPDLLTKLSSIKDLAQHLSREEDK